MITKEQFKQQLLLIKKDEKNLSKNTSLFLDKNPFITDGRGVAASWLYEIVEHSLVNLFLAVNPTISEQTLKNDISYLMYENDWKGEVTDPITNRTWYLGNIDELYDYIQNLS